MYPIEKQELMEIIKVLPNNKSPGPDGIPYEVYKYHINAFSHIFLSLFIIASPPVLFALVVILL